MLVCTAPILSCSQIQTPCCWSIRSTTFTFLSSLLLQFPRVKKALHSSSPRLVQSYWSCVNSAAWSTPCLGPVLLCIIKAPVLIAHIAHSLCKYRYGAVLVNHISSFWLQLTGLVLSTTSGYLNLESARSSSSFKPPYHPRSLVCQHQPARRHSNFTPHLPCLPHLLIFLFNSKPAPPNSHLTPLATLARRFCYFARKSAPPASASHNRVHAKPTTPPCLAPISLRSGHVFSTWTACY